MASTLKGPAIFLAQFAGDAAPFNSLNSICKWAASLGYQGVQIPSWDGRLFDLRKTELEAKLLFYSCNDPDMRKAIPSLQVFLRHFRRNIQVRNIQFRLKNVIQNIKYSHG